MIGTEKQLWVYILLGVKYDCASKICDVGEVWDLLIGIELSKLLIVGLTIY